MIVYFADRQLDIIGQASTELPKGLTITDDLVTDDVETGVSIFEFKMPFDADTRLATENMAAVGNYVLRSEDGEGSLYQIIESETETKKQRIYVYAEDDGMDLLNEVVGEYAADKAYPITHYINKYAASAGFVVGTNEAADLSRKLSWDGETTAAARIASIATQFDGCEVSYSFKVDGLNVVKKYINIYKQRGKDIGIPLRLNYDVDNIITTKSIANLATAFKCTGATPEDKEDPITLKGYSYDDGDFYVDSNGILKSRKALEKWKRLLWKDGEKQQEGGHIVKLYDYDTESQATLCAHAITKLKKVCDMEINFEVDIAKFPDNVKVGDRVNIIDDAGELYLSTRILTLERSICDQTQQAILGEHLLKKSGISEKVKKLAEQFAKTSISVARALAIANAAKAAATAAQSQADNAVIDAENAQKAADAASTAADQATQSAQAATDAANRAESKVDQVEESVSGLQATVDNAQKAADDAKTAAQTANAKAQEAAEAAAQAKAEAAEASAQVIVAEQKADTAIEEAEIAQGTAGEAKTTAEAAQQTAAAAKLDAEQAEKDVQAFEEQLNTVRSTMEADYARKTELTETEASLQSQITQNAAQISSNVKKLQTVDETANNAAEQAEQAQAEAALAKEQANQASADAAASQAAADEAHAAAAAAQSEADNAKLAADTAQAAADKAEEDLEKAKADLATVQGRVDATEEEIEAAEAAILAAQQAADKAHEDAAAAATTATNAQTKADNAVTKAETAQSAANEAARQASLAQQVADEAKGNAAAAQARADEAAQIAESAKETANTAATNATNAQTQANAAAAAAQAAQQAAIDADAKAAQAATDLEEAERNLADVVSRVDATEAEVEAAQADVEAAKTAATTAREEAIAAQEQADLAKADADAAQAAADEAKIAADAAQQAADDAQQAADDAQAAVDALEIRVTEAETQILQTSEQIKLLATKTELTETLGGYYTKEETDAAIQIESNSIKSTVNSQISGIQIGARNLLRKSDAKRWFEEWVLWTSSEASVQDDGWVLVSLVDGGASYGVYTPRISVLPAAGQYILSFDAYSDNAVQLDYNYIMSEGGNTSLETLVAISTQPARYSIPITLAAAVENCGVMIGTKNGTSFYVRDIKLERGNKATEWTPAPEDIDESTDNAQAAADGAASTASDNAGRITIAESTIQQLADSIVSLVRDGNGGSLLTQDSNGLWYFNIGNLEQSISDTANSLDDLNGIVLDANGQIDVLKSTSAALQARTEYVRSYTDENGQPCLELGEGDSVFKVVITNTDIKFMEGTDAPAKINRKMLVIEKTMIKNELQFGDDEAEGIAGVWIWKRRANGNLGLSWKAVSN